MDHLWILLTNAVVLGFRHGIDWDHIAAIMDIVGTTSVADGEGMPIYRPLALSSMYALGHASVVAALGVSALYFMTILPAWIDPVIERLVGVTLLLLGGWICFLLIQHFDGKEGFPLQSRWMLLFALFAKAKQWLWSRIIRQEISNPVAIRRYGFRTAFGVGMIHGIGAETGTQVLLIASIGGAASQGLGAAMLVSFLTGMLISNTLVAVLGSQGFISSKKLKSLNVAVSMIICGFSLVIGTYFTLGLGQELPDLI